MDIKTKEELADQHFWSIIILVVLVVVFAVFMIFFGPEAAGALSGITSFQFVVLSLATFRLTRLLATDNVMLWLRDMCVNVNEKTNPETGLLCIVREKPLKGFRLLLANLFECQWCVSVWAAFIVAVFYISVVLDVFPLGRVVIYVLALAGAASLIQIIVGSLMAQRATDGLRPDQNKPIWNGKERRADEKNVCTSCGI